MIWALVACGVGTTPAPVAGAEPLPTAYHQAAEAAAVARVPDPSRGGPAVASGAGPLPPFTGVDRAVATYVGTPACAGCHAAAARVWSETGHAHAVQTLTAAQKGFDPACLRCHTVGFDHPGGFGPDHTPDDLAAVGCESCHGPGSAHVAAPAAGYGQLPAGPEACVACHTHDNSPGFRWDAGWPRIAHGD